ncbi:hypothetical protein RP20_CCG003233 [Aedes albopictus]|nr:hypothetical protein RP20_CCG003233 [Aedes albopictus]
MQSSARTPLRPKLLDETSSSGVVELPDRILELPPIVVTVHSFLPRVLLLGNMQVSAGTPLMPKLPDE